MSKEYLGVPDIMERFDIGKNAAYELIRLVKLATGDKLPGAKIFPEQLENYKNLPLREERKTQDDKSGFITAVRRRGAIYRVGGAVGGVLDSRADDR